MRVLWFKHRDYPIQRDEYGRSLRRQAFEFFNEGYRPAQVFKQNLVAASMKTLLRYFEDWKKQKYKISHAELKGYLKKHPEFSEKYIKDLADYFEVTPQDIILRIQKPWGITTLSKGELPDKRLYRIQSEMEGRLEAALRLIYLGEHILHNSPKQAKQLIWDIVTLANNTRLVIQKVGGQVIVEKEKLDPKPKHEGETRIMP